MAQRFRILLYRRSTDRFYHVVTEEREYYVRPTSVRIKGATPCLHFVRGAANNQVDSNPSGANYARATLDLFAVCFID